MSIALPSLEGIELTINPEDLPNFRLSKDNDINDDAIKEQSPLEVARDFLSEFQRCLKEKKEDELFYLYDRKFNKLSESVFKSVAWPSSEEIEASDENLEIDVNTVFLYNELCYRHIYARVSAEVDAVIRLKSFENYIELFDTFIHTKDDIVLPVPWIWDILDEFLYQFQTFCQYRAKMREDDESLNIYLENLDNVWNLEKVREIFESLINESKVIKADKSELEDVSANTRTRQYFGYYSLVCLLRLNVLCCDFPAAMETIKLIDFRRLHIYSKALSCLINLFYYAGFTYLMSQRYRESIRLFEVILSCVDKYKQFYSKSFQYDAMTKLADRSYALLAIALSFYPTTIEETILTGLKERLRDPLTKLNKHDTNTFNDLFSYGCPKLIVPIKDKEHFKDFGFEKNIMEMVNKQRDTLSSEIGQIKQLNNLRGVLKLYNTIKLSKLAAILDMNQTQLQDLINLYRARNNAEPKNTPFEQTVIKRLLEATPALEFTIEGDTVRVKDVSTQTNYSKLFYKNINKIDEITREIQAL